MGKRPRRGEDKYPEDLKVVSASPAKGCWTGRPQASRKETRKNFMPLTSPAVSTALHPMFVSFSDVDEFQNMIFMIVHLGGSLGQIQKTFALECLLDLRTVS